MILTIVVGFLIAFITFRLDKLKESVRAEIFCVIMYLFEVLQCVIKKTVKIYSNNAIISIVLMIVIPFVILFVFYLINTLIDVKHKQIGYTEELSNHKDEN